MGAAGVLGGMLGGKLLGGGASFLDKIFSGNFALLMVFEPSESITDPTSIATMAAKVLSRGHKPIENIEVQYHLFKIPINPNELTLDSASQQVKEETQADLCSQRTVKNQTQFATTHLTVTLDYDDMRTSQCFEDGALDFLNPLGMVQSGVHALAALAKTHTVKYQVESMLALLENRGGRMVQFVWNDFIFAGVVEAVQATYTMFDNKGNPVRAKVLLRIQQVMSKSACDKVVDNYKKAFDWKYNVLDKVLGGVGI